MQPKVIEQDLQLLKEQLKKEEEKAKELNQIKCSWCKKWILEDHYYQCIYHKDIFCDACAHDNHKVEVNKGEFTMCKKNLSSGKKADCIWERKIIELKEK